MAHGRAWVALAVAGLGCAKDIAYEGGPPSAPELPAAARAAVTGTVVDKSARPAPGQLVVAAGHSTHTDAQGRFTLPEVPADYDITVLTPDKRHVTMYRGITRRDPVLRHAPENRRSRTARLMDEATGAAAHRAQISGVLSGGGPYPLKASMHVRFLAARVRADVRLGTAEAPGPGWGPIAIAWDGPDTLTGDVLALQMGDGGKRFGEGSRAWFGRQSLTVRAGDDAKVTLTVKEVPVVARPAPIIDMDGDYPLPGPREHYRMAGIGQVFHGGGPFGRGRPAYGPDLSPFGIAWCTEAFEWNPYIRTSRIRCGVPLHTPVSLYLKAGPAFTEPAWNTPAAIGLKFAWSAVAGGVYKFHLSQHGSDQPSPEHPSIDIYTATTSASWPDLGTLGVSFPKPRAAYEASVTALGPFATLDEAVGPQGLTATVPADSWWGMSQEHSVPVQHPIPPEIAACQYPYGRAIVCGKLPNGRDELYVLSAINNKLRAFPDFAKAIGILCVRDCDTARAFSAAFEKYAQDHPDFDAEQPLEPMGPPPPLPDALKRKRD